MTTETSIKSRPRTEKIFCRPSTPKILLCISLLIISGSISAMETKMETKAEKLVYKSEKAKKAKKIIKIMAKTNTILSSVLSGNGKYLFVRYNNKDCSRVDAAELDNNYYNIGELYNLEYVFDVKKAVATMIFNDVRKCKIDRNNRSLLHVYYNYKDKKEFDVIDGKTGNIICEVYN